MCDSPLVSSPLMATATAHGRHIGSAGADAVNTGTGGTVIERLSLTGEL